MHAFLLVNGILLFLILILLFLLSGIWPPDSPWAPWWQMPPEIIRRMCKLAKVNKKSVIYDLGSGTGRALIIAAKEFGRSEEHTSELQSHLNLVCRLLLEKKKRMTQRHSARR